MKTLKELQRQRAVTWSLVVIFSFLQIVPTGWAANAPLGELQAQRELGSVEAITDGSDEIPPVVTVRKTSAPLDTTVFQANESPLSPAVSELMLTPVPATVSPKSKPDILPVGPKPRPDILPVVPNPIPIPAPMPNSDRSPVDEKDAQEASRFLKKTPISQSTISVCTASILAHCIDTTSYYDATGKLIGEKRVSWIEGSDRAQVNWHHSNKKGDPVLVATYVEKIKIDVKNRPVVEAVKADLMKHLGIDAKQLEAWLKQGLIKISFDAGKGTVTVSFSEQLRSQYDGLKNLNLFDPTGASGLPKSIEYHYSSIILMPTCGAGEVCVQGGPMSIVLDSARITNWDGTVGKAQYSNGQLSQVDWYRQYRSDEPRPMRACREGDFTCGMVVDRTVTYGAIASIAKSLENPNGARLLVTVVYHDGRAISKLEFEIGQLMDGKDHILKIREYGQDGKLRVTSEFKYRFIVSLPAEAELDSIVRTDADGKLLSTIKNIRKAGFAEIRRTGVSSDAFPIFSGNYTGDVVLADGQTKSVSFNDFSELLDQARKLELENSVPPAVQAYVDALKSRLGDRFSVTAARQKDGTYLVHIGIANACSPGTVCVQFMPEPIPGSFVSMDFSLTADGILNRDSVNVSYRGLLDLTAGGVLVDGKFLLDAMGALEASFHPEGSAWMPPPVDYMARLVQLATQIVVKESAENLLRFDHDGKSYKATRDTDGNVILEEVLPPAVEAYVKVLQEQIGAGFKVTATFQEDGTYLITVADTKDSLAASTTGLHQLSFSLSVEGVMDPQSLQATYYGVSGDIRVDGQLLYEAMGVCPKGQECTMQDLLPIDGLKKMTRVVVTKVEDGAIFYTQDGKNYKVYRDADGNVILEEDTLGEEVDIQVRVIDPVTGQEKLRTLRFNISLASGDVYEGENVIGSFEFKSPEPPVPGLQKYFVIHSSTGGEIFWGFMISSGQIDLSGAAVQADFPSAADLDVFMNYLGKVVYDTANFSEEDARYFSASKSASLSRSVFLAVRTALARAIDQRISVDYPNLTYVLWEMSLRSPISSQEGVDLTNQLRRVFTQEYVAIPAGRKVNAVQWILRMSVREGSTEFANAVMDLGTEALKLHNEVSELLYDAFFRTVDDLALSFAMAEKENLESFLAALEPLTHSQGSSRIRYYASAIFYGFSLSPKLGQTVSPERLSHLFDLFRDEKFFGSEDVWGSMFYIHILMRGILNHTQERALTDVTRSQVVNEYGKLFQEIPDLLSKIRQLYEATQISWIMDFSNAGLVAKSDVDRGRVSALLNLSPEAAAIFKDFGVLVVSGNAAVTREDLLNIRSWIENYPPTLIAMLGSVIINDQSGSHGGAASVTSMIYGMRLSSHADKSTFDHEFAHSFLGYSANPLQLPEKAWIRKKLFELGTQEDRVSSYANTNVRENIAEYGKYMMLDTQGQLDYWISKAIEGRFIGLRTLLSILEIHVYNSGGQGMPLYANGPAQYVTAQTDADHNITMFELLGQRYAFTYTADSLHIETMTIENIQTGGKNSYRNPAAFGEPVPLTRLGKFMESLKLEIGEGFDVSYLRAEGGGYFFVVENKKSPIASGELFRLIFRLDAEYKIDLWSVDATYNEIEWVHGELVFSGLQQLLVDGQKPDDQQVLVWMTQIHVTGMEGWIQTVHFTKDGLYYKAYRDASGNVVLEQESSPYEILQSDAKATVLSLNERIKNMSRSVLGMEKSQRDSEVLISDLEDPEKDGVRSSLVSVSSRQSRKTQVKSLRAKASATAVSSVVSAQKESQGNVPTGCVLSGAENGTVLFHRNMVELTR